MVVQTKLDRGSKMWAGVKRSKKVWDCKVRATLFGDTKVRGQADLSKARPRRFARFLARRLQMEAWLGHPIKNCHGQIKTLELSNGSEVINLSKCYLLFSQAGYSSQLLHGHFRGNHKAAVCSSDSLYQWVSYDLQPKRSVTMCVVCEEQCLRLTFDTTVFCCWHIPGKLNYLG